MDGAPPTGTHTLKPVNSQTQTIGKRRTTIEIVRNSRILRRPWYVQSLRRNLRLLNNASGPEIVYLTSPIGPLLPQNALEKVGGLGFAVGRARLDPKKPAIHGPEALLSNLKDVLSLLRYRTQRSKI